MLSILDYMYWPFRWFSVYLLLKWKHPERERVSSGVDKIWRNRTQLRTSIFATGVVSLNNFCSRNLFSNSFFISSRKPILSHPFSSSSTRKPLYKMRSLEPGKLIEDWAKWRREFKIHLATTSDILDNEASLHLLLDTLGEEGCALVKSLFPQLKEESQGQTLDQLTFAEVWWRFNQHCLVKQDPLVEPNLKDNLLKERNELRRISSLEIEKVRKVIA